jgi:predicted DNA-binding protein (UPF0251 family)
MELKEVGMDYDSCASNAGLAEDRNLRYFAPNQLEYLQSGFRDERGEGEYFPRKQYDYLKKVQIDLERFQLTDKQMIAVSLVFYGGLQKNRAAGVMKISAQAVDEHLKAALKKIGAGLG